MCRPTLFHYYVLLRYMCTPANHWLQLSRKTAIVTGAASGIGRAVAETLYEAGIGRLVLADVVVHEDNRGAVSLYRFDDIPYNRDTKVTLVQCDVTNPSQVETLMQRAFHGHNNDQGDNCTTKNCQQTKP
jgi:NADP-dependent 3-hydroxy acid dehydrogenase YdfG